MPEAKPSEQSAMEQQDAFRKEVAARHERKERAKAKKLRTVWFGLGTFGLVGWSVSIPTVVGIALGVWIDRTWPGRHSWTLMLLVVGAALGCWTAWQWIEKESQRDH